MNKSIKKSHEPVTSTPPPGGGRWFFISRETVDDEGTLKSIRRIFRHPARTMDKLLGEVAMAGPGPRYIEMPRLAAKRERQLWRAVKRGRVSQIERKLSALTGQPLWTPPAR